MQEHLRQKQMKLNQPGHDFYTSRGTHVYFKNQIENPDISPEAVVASVEEKIPDHLLSEMEMIIIGHFKEFEERYISAFYKDGILHISNVQESEEDLIDDIVHEIAHSIETPYGYEIYADQRIKSEFLQKRGSLYNKLNALGYKAPKNWFTNTEYDEDFDNFLFQTVGRDKLRMICTGLFINAYAATSLREYFATGFTDFYLYANKTLLKTISPVLAQKLFFLHDIKNLDESI